MIGDHYSKTSATLELMISFHIYKTANTDFFLYQCNDVNQD